MVSVVMEKSDDTLDILHSRLKTAEDDTNDLLTSLTAMGLENKSYRLRSKVKNVTDTLI